MAQMMHLASFGPILVIAAVSSIAHGRQEKKTHQQVILTRWW